MTKFEITKSTWKYSLERIFWKESLKSFAGSLGSDLFLGKKQGSVCSGAGRPDKLGDPGLYEQIHMESENLILTKTHQQGC